MKNIASTAIHSSTLWTIIKIYWSITWRANVLLLTIGLTIVALFPITLSLLEKCGYFDVFRELIFNILPFSSNESQIDHPTVLMRVYTNFWSFICSYGLYFYGFKRIIKLNLYPTFLQDKMIPKNYNNAFFIPIAIYSFIDPGYFSNIDYVSSMIFYLIMTILFYYLLFKNLRKLCN